METTLYDLVYKDPEYIIYKGDSPHLTRGGRVFSHTEQRLVKHIITDLELMGSGDNLPVTAVKLLEFQIDYLDRGVDLIADDLSGLCCSDAFILLKTGQNTGLAQARSELSDIETADGRFMNTLFWSASSVVMNLNRFIEDNFQQIESEPGVEHPFILLLRKHYIILKPEQKSAVHFLSYMHGSGFVLPLLLVLNRITVSEYAKGVLSMIINKRSAKGTTECQSEKDFPYPEMIQQDIPVPGILHYCLTDGFTILDYLNYFRLAADSKPVLLELQKRGEGNELEYKSTLRWDLKLGKTNNAVERASLKTITGFLNSSGGTLLIGIRDDGSVEGIESDRFANDDKFLLHLWTLIRTSLGRDVSPYIQTILEKVGDRTVCIVKCSRSPQPVFLRQPGFHEEFYIRVGPGSNALDISEALRYIRLNYPFV